MSSQDRANKIRGRLDVIRRALSSPSLSLDHFSGDYKRNAEFRKRFQIRMSLHIERNQLYRELERL